MAFLYLPLVQMQRVQLQQTIYQHLIKRSKLNSSLQAFERHCPLCAPQLELGWIQIMDSRIILQVNRSMDLNLRCEYFGQKPSEALSKFKDCTVENKRRNLSA